MNQDGYQVIDSGDFLKLERLGEFFMVRPCLGAPWKRNADLMDAWKNWHACYERDSSGGGKWTYRSRFPDELKLKFSDMSFKVKLTGFGHMGLFPEQKENWQWLSKIIQTTGPKKILNLFGYTGGSSLACAKAGANVCHVDAAKGVVDWARENARLNHVSDAIRWIVDDVQKFVKKEIKRGQRYEGVILDPPTFGRGPGKELWDIDQHIMPLLSDIRKILEPARHFILLSAHSPGYSPLVLENILRDVFPSSEVSCGEMVMHETGSDRKLPAGAFARFFHENQK